MNDSRLNTPADNAAISSPTDIIGSAFDPNGQFAFYTVEVAPASQVDLSTLESSAFREIGRGTTEVQNGKLATLDPTLLSNDSYVIRSTVWDKNGQADRKGVVVNVFGDLKLGNFRLEFTDLSIPLAGFPIQVTRIALRGRHDARTNWLYAAFVILGKVPELRGVARFYWYRFWDRKKHLIEYK